MGKKSPAKILKDKGLIPSNWNLRKLSRGQKSWVTKQTKEFASVVKNPKQFITLKTTTRTQRKSAKELGFKVTNQKTVIYSKNGGRARRVGGRIVTVTRDGSREYFSADQYSFLDVLNAARSIKLKRNQVWSLQIGDFEANIQFRSIDGLMHYFEKVKWDTPQSSDYLKLVLITENNGLFGDE